MRLTSSIASIRFLANEKQVTLLFLNVLDQRYRNLEELDTARFKKSKNLKATSPC